MLTAGKVARFVVCLTIVLVLVYGFWCLIGGSWWTGALLTIGFLAVPRFGLGFFVAAAVLQYFVFDRGRKIKPTA